MAVEENSSKKYILFKSEMLVLKVLPMILALLSLLSTILDRVEINSVIISKVDNIRVSGTYPYIFIYTLINFIYN